MQNQLTIGAVSYLNTKPLVAGLEASCEDYDLIFDLPSRLADRLQSGDLDVALIPSIEAITGNGYHVVSDACIGCEGPVWSVKLLSRVELPQIRTVALDVGSRTSRALTKILLSQQHHCQPRFVDLPMDQDWRDVDTDAVLIIGDRAMHADNADFKHCVDLGEAWSQWTGLPFVFAMWVARSDERLDFLSRLLSNARDNGTARLDEFVDKHHADYGLTVEQCADYLHHRLHYFLGEREKQALERFYRHASQLSLIPNTTELNFHDCQTAR